MRFRTRHLRRDLLVLIVVGVSTGFGLAAANLSVPQGWASLGLGLGVAFVAFLFARHEEHHEDATPHEDGQTNGDDARKLAT